MGERRELVAVGYWLGVDEAEITRLLDTQKRRIAVSPSLERPELGGLSICFTGQLSCRSAASRSREATQCGWRGRLG
ncbi:MAG: hypothetical protein ACRDZO_12710 [Egibacteraceae bacterium]